MKKIFFVGATFVALTYHCFAQTKGLKIGDQVPNYTFTDLINYPKKMVTINGLKGKYIILDFWFIHCTSCIAAFPHMKELQDKFKDKLQIILVNRSDNAKAIKAFFPALKKRTGIDIKLTAQCGDPELLYKYFPNRSNPHEIIIDPTGKIYAITDAESLTTENISAMLSGKHVDFPLKDDYYDKNAPLAVSTTFYNNKEILLSSLFTGYMHGKSGSGIKNNDKGEPVGFFTFNMPLLSYYQEGYSDLFKDSPAIIYETNDPVFQNVEDDFSKAFSYDVIFGTGKNYQDKYKTCLQQDLDKIFQFSLQRKKQTFPCLVIKTNKAITNSYTKYKDYSDLGNLFCWKEVSKKHIAVYGHNVGVFYIVSSMGTTPLFNITKIIDESGVGIDDKFDIEFPVDFDFSNREKLITFLHDKGIDVSVENRELDCVVVSDKKPGDPTVISSQ